MVTSVEFSKYLQIRSIDMLHRRFQSFPEAFSKNLVSQTTKRYTFSLWKFVKGKEVPFDFERDHLAMLVYTSINIRSIWKSKPAFWMCSRHLHLLIDKSHNLEHVLIHSWFLNFQSAQLIQNPLMNVNEHLGYTNSELKHCCAFVFLLYGLAEISNFVKLNHFQVIPSLNSGGNPNCTIVSYLSIFMVIIITWVTFYSLWQDFCE